MEMKHLDPLLKHLRSLEIAPAPPPWFHVTTRAIGGLTAVGFDRTSELLLIVSSAGRGVVDGATGQKVARDTTDYYEDSTFLEAAGIGPLLGKTIRMAGLFGGGLPTITADGWKVEQVCLNWPITEVLLVEPGSDLFDVPYGKTGKFHKIMEWDEIRACGFSYSGNTFVIATPSDIAIYSKQVA